MPIYALADADLTLNEIDAVARTTQSFVVELQVMVDRLNRASENLEHLTDILREQPSTRLPPCCERPARASTRWSNGDNYLASPESVAGS